MSSNVDLTLFAHVVSRPDAEIDLAQAALLIADYPPRGVNAAACIARLDELGELAARAVGRGSTPSPLRERPIERLLRWMFEDQRFHGNTTDYYDPRNSYLDQVIELKTGIPITLAIVLMEVGKRAGLVLQGVSFPGHFLVRYEGDDGAGLTLIDPFEGRILHRDDLRALYKRATGLTGDPGARVIQPATKREILRRMLDNLLGVYALRDDQEGLDAVSARMDALSPSSEIPAHLARLGGKARGPSGGSTLH